MSRNECYSDFGNTVLSLWICPVFCHEFQQIELLAQLYSQNDSSIVARVDHKYYVNTDNVHISQEGIFLCSDFNGLIPLKNLNQDSIGTYTVGLYSYYRCDKCGAWHKTEPSVCGVDECESTSFTYVECLPPDCCR